MRFALPLVAAFALLALVACGGEDAAAPSEPAALAERVLTEADAPGSKPDPVEKRQTTVDFDEFIEAMSSLAIDPNMDELADVFTEAGFEAAIVDTRFYGEEHRGGIPHITSGVIQLSSEEEADAALAWIVADDMKPCPQTCAVRITEFGVDGISDTRGVHRSQSAEDIESLGTKDDMPFDSYRIAFTDGVFVHTIDLHGTYGSVTEDQVTDIAHALHGRVSDLSS